MARATKTSNHFNILIVGQGGRLEYEALLFVASVRAQSPLFSGQVIVAEPQPGPLWDRDPRMSAPVKAHLEAMGAKVVPFQSVHFGQSYPQGNKIEGLQTLPAGEPFVFFDTDTLVTGELSELAFDFTKPAASMRRDPTWPVEELYWPGYTAVWKSLYDRCGLDFESSLDLTQPDEYWERYLYFNAGWFFGTDPAAFGARFTEYAVNIRDNPPKELIIQPLNPWLDQVVLPLVIHSFGGGRPGPELSALDGAATYHYRVLPLFYATASDVQITLLEEITAPNKLKKLLKLHEPFKRMVYQGRGQKVRDLFDQSNMPRHEKAIRNQIKSAGFWMR